MDAIDTVVKVLQILKTKEWVSATSETASPTAAALIKSLREAPFGDATKGAFFPGSELPPRMPMPREFERLGDAKSPLVMRIRHLPVGNVVERVLKMYGDRASKLMVEWTEAWRKVPGGPEEFAKRIRYVIDGNAGPSWPTTRTATRIEEGIAGEHEARELFVLAAMAAEPPPARALEQHALEDAMVMTSLLKHKVPVGFFGEYMGDKSLIVRFSPDGKCKISKLRRAQANETRGGFGRPDAYWLLSSFLATSGRWMAEVEGMQHLTLMLLDMARHGRTKVFLKHCSLKGGTWVVDLSDVNTAADAACAVLRAIWPTYFYATRDMLLEEDARRFLVQDFVPFEREHRFFVVRNRIVASTASDRLMTVLDAPKRGRLDSRVAALRVPAAVPGKYDRGEATSQEDRKLVAAMARRVRGFLRAIQSDDTAEALLPDAFVVDVGSGPNGIGLIEINTFRNAGLYGVDYDRIARSLPTIGEWPNRLLEPRVEAANPDTTASAVNMLFRWTALAAEASGEGKTGNVWQSIEESSEKPADPDH
jgi:hypothetical protein